ncbi:MAG TPA: type II toxin-antitoxin system HipA family toxin [Noviherbaspirillum sp.]|nr:type II toxin-antitoxin system HipA family toxin [Noviherbaspirillum sp.]
MVAKTTRRSRHRHLLNVWMNGQLVGTWTVRDNKRHQFRYAQEWIDSDASRIMSLSLPFIPGNLHEGAVVENFFDNLLPDNREIRQRLQRKFGANSPQAFDLLAEIGRDCVGAIQLLPDSDVPEGWNKITATPLSEQQVETILRTTVTAPPGDQNDTDFRISIAGAQEKTALLWHNGQWHKPNSATPTTHILKLPLGLVGGRRADMRTSVENEWLCAKVMAAYGLDVAHCEIGTFGEEKALVVERFDRRKAPDGDYWLRLPQEDMCQATGTPPSTKYEADGGPGMKAVLELLRGSLRQDQDRRTFFKAQILFWMLAAIDGHAKNYSIFLERGSTYRMTPLYDVLSAWPVVGTGPNHLSRHDVKMAMAWRAKNAHYRRIDVQRRHFNEVAAKLGIGKDAEEIIEELLDSTPGVITDVERLLPKDFPVDVAEAIFRGLEDSVQMLKSQH